MAGAVPRGAGGASAARARTQPLDRAGIPDARRPARADRRLVVCVHFFRTCRPRRADARDGRAAHRAHEAAERREGLQRRADERERGAAHHAARRRSLLSTRARAPREADRHVGRGVGFRDRALPGAALDATVHRGGKDVGGCGPAKARARFVGGGLPPRGQARRRALPADARMDAGQAGHACDAGAARAQQPGLPPRVPRAGKCAGLRTADRRASGGGSDAETALG